VAYKTPNKWKVEDISVVLVDEVPEGDVVTMEVSVGDVSMQIMAEVTENGRRLIATDVHVTSASVNPNEVGIANLRQVAQAIMEIGDYDEIIAEGAIRTTGAHPGHRPRQIRIARNRGLAPEPGPSPNKVG
jgi:hypothetical protein